MTDWTPTKYRCTKCQDIIYSKWSGHYAQCTCGETFVDETRHYVRLGGHPVLSAESAEPTGPNELTKPED